MPKDEKSATIAADNLLEMIIKNQPNLFEMSGLHETGGKDMAKAVAGLRQGLIEMYKTQP